MKEEKAFSLMFFFVYLDFYRKYLKVHFRLQTGSFSSAEDKEVYSLGRKFFNEKLKNKRGRSVERLGRALIETKM